MGTSWARVSGLCVKKALKTKSFYGHCDRHHITSPLIDANKKTQQGLPHHCTIKITAFFSLSQFFFCFLVSQYSQIPKERKVRKC